MPRARSTSCPRSVARILDDRVSICAAKGFDGVEFDNVDGYSNKTGFALTAQDLDAWRKTC